MFQDKSSLTHTTHCRALVVGRRSYMDRTQAFLELDKWHFSTTLYCALPAAGPWAWTDSLRRGVSAKSHGGSSPDSIEGRGSSKPIGRA